MAFWPLFGFPLNETLSSNVKNVCFLYTGCNSEEYSPLLHGYVVEDCTLRCYTLYIDIVNQACFNMRNEFIDVTQFEDYAHKSLAP